MRIVFNHEEYKSNSISPEIIKDEVDMVGFSAELLEMIENNPDELLKQEYCQSQASIDAGDIDTLNLVRGKSPNVIKTCNMIIEGMTCASCQSAIESHLKSLDGVVTASVSLLTHRAVVQYRSKLIGIRTLIEEVEAIGFTARFEA